MDGEPVIAPAVYPARSTPATMSAVVTPPGQHVVASRGDCVAGSHLDRRSDWNWP